MAEADQVGFLKRTWRRLGEFAEAMDTTEASYTSDRISRLEQQVRELQTRLPNSFSSPAIPVRSGKIGEPRRDAV